MTAETCAKLEPEDGEEETVPGRNTDKEKHVTVILLKKKSSFTLILSQSNLKLSNLIDPIMTDNFLKNLSFLSSRRLTVSL